MNWLRQTVGHGVPRLDVACACSAGRVTMVSQSELQPFTAANGGDPRYNECHIYTLPWPDTGLSAVSPTRDVRMRVTLSYFVEPNPGNRSRSRYGYPGCRRRFRVSSPQQGVDDLRAWVNQIAHEDALEEGRVTTRRDPQGWRFGDDVFQGSVHSDIWEGSAADLLNMKHIAVFPTAGWWKTRPALGRANSRVRYSLLVSLYAGADDIDLYAEVANQVRVPVAVEVASGV